MDEGVDTVITPVVVGLGLCVLMFTVTPVVGGLDCVC